MFTQWEVSDTGIDAAEQALNAIADQQIVDAAHHRWHDIEEDHIKADEILLSLLPPAIRAAYERIDVWAA